MQQNRSEVAELMRAIHAENEAAQRMFNDPAMVGGHEFIERRTIGSARAMLRLRDLVGDQRAAQLTDQAFDATDDEDLELHIQESIDAGDFEWWSPEGE